MILLDGFIFVYNVYVFVHVSAVTHYAWAKQGQRATSNDGPWLPFCLRQGFLLFAAMYTGLAGLQASGGPPVSAFHLAMGALGLHRHYQVFWDRHFVAMDKNRDKLEMSGCGNVPVQCLICEFWDSNFISFPRVKIFLVFSLAAEYTYDVGQSLPLYPTSNLCSTVFIILLHHVKRIEYSVLFLN